VTWDLLEISFLYLYGNTVALIGFPPSRSLSSPAFQGCRQECHSNWGALNMITHSGRYSWEDCVRQGMSFYLAAGQLLTACCRLYGVTCSQIYNYFSRRFQDSVCLKWTVCISRKASRYSDHDVHASRSCSSGMFSPPGWSCSLLILTSRVLDTFDAVLNGHFLYYYLVTNHADPMAIEKLVWSVIVSSTNCPRLLSIFSFELLLDTCRSHSRFIYD